MQRYDTVALPATRTKEGFIRDAPVVGRTGILHYLNADGTDRFEYRPPEEAFAAESLESLKGKPITMGHHGLVTSGNVAEIRPIGTVLTEGKKDGETIRADIIIYSLPSEARELSCGYTLDLDETPGTTPGGERYDAIQRNIRYNHVAVVPKGRAGIARLNMDGAQILDDERGEETMVKVRVDNGLEYDAVPEVAQYVSTLQASLTKARGDTDTLQARCDALSSDLKKEQEARAADKKKHEDAFTEAVKNRVAVLSAARKYHIEKADSLSDLDIKKAVIKAVRGDMDLDGRSDAYIEAAYDMACADESHHEDGLAKQREAINRREDGRKGNQKHSDGDDIDYDDPEAVEAKIRKDEAEAYKKRV